MNLITVRCNECGAPLQVPPTANYLTCTHCGSQLGVQRTGDAIFTEKLDAIAAKTDHIAGNLEVIRIQNEIEKLDREWSMEREQFMVRDKNGHVQEPGAASSVIAGVIGTVFGIIFIGFSANMNVPVFQLFGFLFIGLSVFGMFRGVSKASAMQNARARYEAQRRELNARLGAVQNGGR